MRASQRYRAYRFPLLEQFGSNAKYKHTCSRINIQQR
jgi:hypothetical protein